MAGKRINLAALADRTVPDLAVVPQPIVEPPPSPLPVPVSSAPTPVPPARSRAAAAAPEEPRPGEWVRYDQYERKEARLRPDQYGRLSELSRALNRTRAGRGERITENTLIRVAIDMLLADAARLAGTNETELRNSAGL